MIRKKRIIALVLAVVMLICAIQPWTGFKKVYAETNDGFSLPDGTQSSETQSSQTESSEPQDPGHENKDTTGPQVVDLNIHSLEKYKDEDKDVEEEKPYEKIVKRFKWFDDEYDEIQEAFVIEIKVKDLADSEEDVPVGVKSVKIINQFKDEILEDESKINISSDPNGEVTYAYTIDKSFAASNITIVAEDNAGYKTEKTFNEVNSNILNNLSYKEKAPKITLKCKNEIKNGDDIWFKSNGEIYFSISTSCKKVKGYTISERIGDGLVEKVTKTCNKKTWVFDTETLKAQDFEDGKHTLVISVTRDGYDGGIEKFSREFVINVEKNGPQISLDSPKVTYKDLDGNEWLDINREVEFTATIAQPASGIKSYSVKINGVQVEDVKELKPEESKPEESKPEDDKTIHFTIGPEMYKEIINQRDNKIKVQVDATSNIDGYSSQEKTYCVDADNPEIKEVRIQNAKAISSGIYTKNGIRIKVKAKDLGVGVKKVQLGYTVKGEEEVLEQTEARDNDTYEFEIALPSGTTVFSSDIKVTAYDYWDKVSEYTPRFKDSDGNESDTNFVMYETSVPEMITDMPESDAEENINDQIWYNKNHDIKILVKDSDSGIACSGIMINGEELISSDSDQKEIFTTEIKKNERGDIESVEYTVSTHAIEEYIKRKNRDGEKIEIDKGYVISASAIDNAGNTFTSSLDPFYIDTTAPQINKYRFSVATSDNKNETTHFVDDKNYQYFFNKPVTLNIECTDGEISCGLNKVFYELVTYGDEKNPVTEKDGVTPIINGVAKIELPIGFKGRVYTKANDKLNNMSRNVTTAAYVVDINNPEITYSTLKECKTKDAKGNKLYASNVAYTVRIKDEESGIRNIASNLYSDGEVTTAELKLDLKEHYKAGDKLDDNWTVVSVDNNLVTEVKKTIKITEDANDISSRIDVNDMCSNSKSQKSEVFSVDKTAPVIDVTRTKGVKEDENMYGPNNKAVMTITVEERNFNAKLIKTMIENSYTHKVPKVVFNKIEENKYQAVIQFPEGDYDISVSGQDRAENEARVSFEGKTDKAAAVSFNVDETAPKITTNFGDFSGGKGKDSNLFNKVKTAVITANEHNFNPELMDVKVYEKQPGQGYTLVKDNESSYAIYSDKGWVDKGEKSDIHTLTMEFKLDGIYMIKIAPKDIAGNVGNKEQTAVFEIDRTAPVIVARNGVEVDPSKTKIVDVYDFDKKDEKNPSVEFDDVNFDHIEYSVTQFTSKYNKDKEIDKIKGKYYSSKNNSKKFKLKNFEQDGVYAVDIIAYDKAGNSSKVVTDTYMKMIDADVLAYIENSHPGKNGQIGTGWYSIEDEDGAISKRPDDFQDINVAVFSKNNAATSISLNDNNGNVTDMGLTADVSDVAYGLKLHRYTIEGEYFKRNYQEDTDATFYLTANAGKQKFELGQIHIDNIVPECDLPEYFHDWGWIKGTNPEPVEISNINEKIDTDRTAVYVDGQKVDFTYNLKDSDLKFDIAKGTHSVGISLVDMAGNRYDIPEINNLGVGNFRAYMGFGAGSLVILLFCFIIYIRRKRSRE